MQEQQQSNYRVHCAMQHHILYELGHIQILIDTYCANYSVELALAGHLAIAFLESTFQASAEIPG